MISASVVLLAAIVAALLYLAYETIRKTTKLLLTYVPSARNLRILQLCPAISETVYSPTFYLSNGHLQTLYYAIYHAIATPVHLYPYKRELLHLSDGGQIALDWIMDPTLKLQIDTPVLAVIPGLTGCLDDCYIRSLVEEGTKRGFKCVVVNHRGCGNTPLTSPKMQCAGNISDVEAAFRRIKQKFASNPLYAVGISLGSCILGNYVISKGSKCGLKGMSLVSVPYEAYTLSKIMDRQLFNIYHWGLGFSLVQQMKEHKNELKSLESMLGLSIEACTRKIKTLRDFDNVVTSKVYGYKTTDSYYRSISLASKLGAITIPCFLLSPLDDPIIPKELIPYDEVRKNDNIILGTHPCAGHGSYYTGLKPKSWYQYPVIDFFAALDKLSRQQ